MKQIEDKFSHIPSATKRWQLRHPEASKAHNKGARKKKAQYGKGKTA